jgi:hypothetical protein
MGESKALIYENKKKLTFPFIFYKKRQNLSAACETKGPFRDKYLDKIKNSRNIFEKI